MWLFRPLPTPTTDWKTNCVRKPGKSDSLMEVWKGVVLTCTCHTFQKDHSCVKRKPFFLLHVATRPLTTQDERTCCVARGQEGRSACDTRKKTSFYCTRRSRLALVNLTFSSVPQKILKNMYSKALSSLRAFPGSWVNGYPLGSQNPSIDNKCTLLKNSTCPYIFEKVCIDCRAMSLPCG